MLNLQHLVGNVCYENTHYTVEERSHLSEGVCHPGAAAQPRLCRLGCCCCACSTRFFDLSRLCGNRHGEPVPIPCIPGSLPALAQVAIQRDRKGQLSMRDQDYNQEEEKETL